MNVKFWLMLVANYAFMLAVSAAYASEPILLLPANQAQVPYNHHIAYWVDASNKADLAQAQLAQYAELNHKALSNSADAHWFKIKVRSDAHVKKTWVFTMYWPPLDWIDIWVVHNTPPDSATNASTRSVQNVAADYFALGDHRPYIQRMIKSRLPAVPVVLAPNEHATIYVRVISTSLILMLGDFWEEDPFYAHEKTSDLLYGFYFGLFIMVGVIFILLGLWLNDRGMLAYSAFVMSFVVSVLGINGFVNVLFPYSTARLSDATVGISTLAVGFFSTMMWVHLLKLKDAYPRLHLCAWAIMLFCVLAMPFVMGPYYGEIATVLRVLGIVISIVPAYVAFVMWRHKRQIEYLIYFLSFLFINMSAVVYLLMMDDFINLSVERGMYYQNSLFFNILIMSVGLAFRIRQIQHDKTQAEHSTKLAVQRTQEERRFVAMLSHEFRNPLAVISYSAQMLQMTRQDLEAKTTARLDNICVNTSRLSSLVDNFLLSEQIANEQLPLNIERHALTDLLADIRLQVADADWQRIDVVCADDHYAFDLNLLSMAVGNLIHNALRYAYPNTNISLSMAVNAQGLSIVVSDKGPGISQEEIALLGTPYYRAASSMGKKGTGLGYYFTRRIVDLHHGSMLASLNQVGGLDVNIVLVQNTGS